jgi:hypothetical protein
MVDEARNMRLVQEAGFQVLSLVDDQMRLAEYKRRRSHEKTKLGCRTCKKKRVKVG